MDKETEIRMKTVKAMQSIIDQKAKQERSEMNMPAIEVVKERHYIRAEVLEELSAEIDLSLSIVGLLNGSEQASRPHFSKK